MNNDSPYQQSHPTTAMTDDTYSSRTKLANPPRCKHCGAVYLNGRWRWSKVPEDTPTSTCPACQREEDHFPAGHIEMKGNFLKQHQEEILALIKDMERKERRTYPLERIMEIEQRPDRLRIKTTGTHLARGIGDALFDLYHGNESVYYLDDEKCIRVTWKR